MSSFETLFALFGLVLGLAIADILACFARALDSRPRIRVGWLTPLLAVIVLLDVTTYWALAWMLRDEIPANLPALIGALLFSSLYYLAAYRVFPAEFAEGLDLDERFFEVRRFVLGVLVFARILQLLAVASVFDFAPALTNIFTLATFALMFSFYGLTMAARSKRALVPLMVTFISFYLVGPILAQ